MLSLLLVFQRHIMQDFMLPAWDPLTAQIQNSSAVETYCRIYSPMFS